MKQVRAAGGQISGKAGELVFPEVCGAGGVTFIMSALPRDLAETKLDFTELCGAGLTLSCVCAALPRGLAWGRCFLRTPCLWVGDGYGDHGAVCLRWGASN